MILIESIQNLERDRFQQFRVGCGRKTGFHFLHPALAAPDAGAVEMSLLLETARNPCCLPARGTSFVHRCGGLGSNIFGKEIYFASAE